MGLSVLANSFLQLLCSGSGEIEALALCFLAAAFYFVEKAPSMLSPALEFVDEPPAFLSFTYSSWLAHF
jgi:hypothetical protein